MRSVIKKAAAAALAVVLAATLCGCDRGYIMTVEGMDIRNGVYLSLLRTAYSSAQDEVKKQNSDETSSDETSSVPVTDEQIDGVSGSQWIKDEAMKAVRRFVAVQQKCDEFGLTLTEEELGEINSDINDMWDNENEYLKYAFGYDTMGEYYESQGIGKESIKEINMVSKLQTKLLMYYYGKGGTLEVPESEIDEYLKENYAVVKALGFAYTDASGKKLESDEDKKAVKDEAQAYADRINKGEKPADIFYEYNLLYVERKVNAQAETEYSEDNAEGLTKEEWIKAQIEAAGVEKYDSEDELDNFISKESSGFDEDTTEYIFNAPSDGKATLFDTENGVYLIIKEDITQKTNWKEENNERVLVEIKGDEFQSMVDLFGQNYEVTADESLVNKKYGPEKLNS